MKKLTAYELYTRASFVSLLQHIKVSNVVDWSPFMQTLVKEGIMEDETLNMGPHNLQSLFVHLDMLSVWKVEDTFDWWHPRTFELGGAFDHDKRYMCTCGYGVFPTNYLKDLKQPKDLLKHAVRVAVPVIFASPLNTDDPGSVVPLSPSAMPTSVPQGGNPQGGDPQGQAPAQTTEPRLVDLSAKEGTCWDCGAKSCNDGSMLLRCAKCKMAQYCSAECQKRDWKNSHKQLCPQLTEESVQLEL
jgi:hypothetical protein